jgi:hypothetical protein
MAAAVLDVAAKILCLAALFSGDGPWRAHTTH